MIRQRSVMTMSALALRAMACVCMLLDHIGFLWNILPLRMIGRVSLPIFAFLIYNGFVHTRSRGSYAFRLALFALLSQIPFSLLCKNEISFANWNVMLTLLLAMLCLWCIERFREFKLTWLGIIPVAALFVLYYKGILQSDYGFRGILTVLSFGLFYNRSRLLTALSAGLATLWPFLEKATPRLLLIALGRDLPVPVMTQWQVLQLFAMLALIPIFFYNGQKGRCGGRAMQYGFYAFYPAHMLLLWALLCAF